MFDIINIGDYMKIEKIKKTKSGNYILELDNNEKIKTYDEVILKNNLLFNKEINTDLLNKLNIDNSYYDIYNKVIKYISTKMRSELEIKKYLEKLGCIEKNKIIDELKKINLINDNLFLKAFINDKINLTLSGPYKIKKELLEHNICEEDIDNYLNEIDMGIYYERINKLIDKKIKTNKNKSIYILKQKILAELIDLGYSKDMINEVLNNYKINEDDIIKKEYDLLYKKLSKKYNGNELEYQIKNKLYAKGFNSESINSILNIS